MHSVIASRTSIHRMILSLFTILSSFTVRNVRVHTQYFEEETHVLLWSGIKSELTPTPKTYITSPCPTPSTGHAPRNRNLLLLVPTGIVRAANSSGRCSSSESSSCNSNTVPLQYRHSDQSHRVRAADSRLPQRHLPVAHIHALICNVAFYNL